MCQELVRTASCDFKLLVFFSSFFFLICNINLSCYVGSVVILSENGMTFLLPDKLLFVFFPNCFN